MIDTEASLHTARLVHPICLLDAPACDARPLAILPSDSYAQVGPPIKGFLPVTTSGGLRGYIPAAACAPFAADVRGEAPPAGVVQDVALYRTPTPGDQFASRWIVPKEESLHVLEKGERFVRVRRQDGQVGYVPAILCRAIPTRPGAAPMIQLVQPVSLYSDPAPGSQLDSRWIVAPADTLLLLGREGNFALIQRESGQLGYVPAVLLGQQAADRLIPIGPADLGWITLGGLWGLLNWGGLAAALAQPFVPEELRPYALLVAALGVAALLWLGSRRRVAARSFALGLLLAYAFLHLVTGGRATLWS
jgi:hypothetical protein